MRSLYDDLEISQTVRKIRIHSPRDSVDMLSDDRSPARYDAAQQSDRDRRATPRLEMGIVFEELRGGKRSFRTTHDLSTFGLSTTRGAAYRVGTALMVRLHLPDDLAKPISLASVVVGAHQTTGGMRLAFRSPPAEAVRRIHKYLFSRSSQASGEA